MEIKIKAKHIRISPRKVRLVVDVIRGMEVEKAMDQLKFINKRAVRPVEKLILSGVANAKHNWEIERDNLKIAAIRVDEGATLKRWKPRAHGRATPIRKRTSHITVTLAEIKASKGKKAKKVKPEAPVKLGEAPKKEDEVKIKKAKELKEEKIASAGTEVESGKEIIDQRAEGKGKHTKIEGGKRKGFVSKFFRRKSG